MLVAQITDTHITIDGRQAADLERIIARLNSCTPPPNAVIVSGDLTNNGRAEQYARLRDILSGCRQPVFVVPGNHDRRLALREMLPSSYYPGVRGERLNFAIETAPVRIIGLDTTAPGRPGGSFDDTGLQWFGQALTTAPQTPTLLFMHHPPFRTGVNLADMFGFGGLGRFRALVARNPQVRRIVAGHVHCERSAVIGAALVTTARSSTPQRVPELFERHFVGLRAEPAGYALHTWEREAFTTTTYTAAGNAFVADSE